MFKNQTIDFQEAQIDWNDLERMHFERKSTGRLKRWIPSWAADDKKVQLVVYNYLWNYCHRFARAHRAPGMALRDLENEATKFKETIRRRLPLMAGVTQHNLNLHLAATENGIAATTVRIIYMAYRQGLTNPDIAAEFGTTAFAIRTRLWRINELARKLFKQDDNFPRHHTAGRTVALGVTKRITKHVWRSEEMTNELVRRYKGGETLTALSKAFDMPIATAWYHLKKAGLDTHRLKPRLKQEVLADLARRYNEGESARSLAKACDRSVLTLMDSLRRTGLLKPRLKPQLTLAEVAEIARRYNAGESARSLANACGRAHQTVLARMKNAGLIDPEKHVGHRRSKN